jgi:hypothetical protein
VLKDYGQRFFSRIYARFWRQWQAGNLIHQITNKE